MHLRLQHIRDGVLPHLVWVANHVPEGYVILAILLLVGCGAIFRAVDDLTIVRMELAGIQGEPIPDGS